MQQRAPAATVHHIVEQGNSLNMLKSLGTLQLFPSVANGNPHELSVLFFIDARPSADNGQILYIGGLLIGDMEKGSISHVLWGSLHKARRLVQIIGATEILAAGDAIGEGKELARSLSQICSVGVPLQTDLDSKELFTSLSTQRSRIDKSIRPNVSVKKFELECGYNFNVV